METINNTNQFLKSLEDSEECLEAFISEREASEAEIDKEEIIKEGFFIKNKEQANYFLKLLKEINEEIEEINKTAESKKEKYNAIIDEWVVNSTKSLISTKNYFETILQSYASKEYAQDKKNKTIKLPYGKLSFKKQQDKYEYDENVLLEYLKTNNLTDYINVKETPKKGDIKKVVTVKGEEAFLDNVKVPGITVLKQPEKFEIK